MRRITEKRGRRRVRRGLHIGGFVALLLLVAAVPALAAVTSSTSYTHFATTANQGNNEWSNQNQAVTIIAVPSTDTTATIHFSANGGSSFIPWTATATGTASHDFQVITEGSNVVQFYATDSTPATQTVQTPGRVNIDKTRPAFTASTGLAPVSTQSAEAQWSQEVTRSVTLTATDTVPAPGIATSGVRSIARRVNGGTVETANAATVTFSLAKGVGTVTEGSNEVTYTALDWAGNVTTATAGYVNIDTVMPTTTPSPALAGSATTGWFNTSPVTVTLNWIDVSSGVPAGGTWYRLNDAVNPTTYLNPFSVSAQGSTKLTYRSVDRALNVEATQTAYVNIDTGNPTVSATTTPSRRSGWYNKDVVVTMDPEDPVSGIAKTQYRVEEDPPLLWIDATDNEFTVDAGENAMLVFEYQAVDNAGNVSTTASLALNMDTIRPTTHGKSVTGKVKKSIPLKYKIKDNLSPKAQSVWFKIKNSKGKTIKSQRISGSKTINKWYTYRWKPKAKGTYRYYVYAKDLAGNSQKSPGSAKIKVK